MGQSHSNRNRWDDYNSQIHVDNSQQPDDDPFPFHQLVPDCRELVLGYCFRNCWDIVDRSAYINPLTPPSPECISNLKFALRYFKCHMDSRFILLHYNQEKRHNMDFWCGVDIPGSHSLSSDCWLLTKHSHIFPCLENLVELHLTGEDPSKCRAVELSKDFFQPWRSLRSLHIDKTSNLQISDEMFSHLQDLKHLTLSSTVLTDGSFENLYNAGSRLVTLEIDECPHITNDSFTFLKGGSLRELNISQCTQISSAGLAQIRGVERLKLFRMCRINCREAFQCMEGSAGHLHMTECSALYFDEEAISYLNGISSVHLCAVQTAHVPAKSFRSLSGSIKTLNMQSCMGLIDLKKDILCFLAGIEHLVLTETGVKIQAKHFPALKQIFSTISYLKVCYSFADVSTLKKLKEFVEGNG